MNLFSGYRTSDSCWANYRWNNMFGWFVIDRFVIVFACLTLSVFSTIDEYQKTADAALLQMEGLVVFWFTVEFIFR